MNEAIIRTEDIDPRDIHNYFVETERDREIINQLKGKQPLLVVGSRGTGKTMLLRMAEQELLAIYDKNRVLPVFVNLVTIEQVLAQSEADLRKIPYIGEVRSRQINNIVYNAILEYISG